MWNEINPVQPGESRNRLPNNSSLPSKTPTSLAIKWAHQLIAISQVVIILLKKLFSFFKELETLQVLTQNRQSFLLQGLHLSSAMISMFYLFSFYTNISSVSVESLQLIGPQFLTCLTITAQLLKTWLKTLTLSHNLVRPHFHLCHPHPWFLHHYIVIMMVAVASAQAIWVQIAEGKVN